MNPVPKDNCRLDFFGVRLLYTGRYIKRGTKKVGHELESNRLSLLACTFHLCLLFSVAALIRENPSSVIVEEGENVNLECKASSLPMPTMTWLKAFGHLPRGKTTVIDGNMTILSVTKDDRGTYVCSVKNLLGEESAFSVVTVIDRLRFTITPPIKVVTFEPSSLMLNCKAKGSLEITWKRANKNLPENHIVFFKRNFVSQKGYHK